jgi:hypothetical protein
MRGADDPVSRADEGARAETQRGLGVLDGSFGLPSKEAQKAADVPAASKLGLSARARSTNPIIALMSSLEGPNAKAALERVIGSSPATRKARQARSALALLSASGSLLQPAIQLSPWKTAAKASAGPYCGSRSIA